MKRAKYDADKVASTERALIEALRRSMGIPPNPSNDEIASLIRCLAAVHPIRNQRIEVARCREAARDQHINQLRKRNTNHG